MISGRKKILFQTDFSLAKTGFGRTAKAILVYLYNLNKYDIVHYCCGEREDSIELQKTPWKSIGCVTSDPREKKLLAESEDKSKKAYYGVYNLDKVISQEKPDIYIGIQDIWGLIHAIEKPWFKKITSIIWTTLDSLPILPAAIEAAKKSDNFWIWSDFATKELHKLGLTHAKTIHGPIEDKFFHRLLEHERFILREKNEIDQSAFIVGFVFRNQMRKSVPNLLQGFSEWKKNHNVNSKLLLHTSWSEGWDINKLSAEVNLSREDILITHFCRSCKNYSVKTFEGEGSPCKHCGLQDSCYTPIPEYGVSESQLNEIYNMMDVYCHPFTSGGQEIPIQEAKLAELITLVTNYSCGEEMCLPEAHSIPLDWTEYREHKSEYIKASTTPDSIAQSIHKVYTMDKEERESLGKKARQWVIDNYSVKNVCKTLEDFIDESPKTKYDYPSENGINILDPLNELSEGDKNKKILFVMPGKERDIFLSTSLFRSINDLYPKHNLYVATNKKYFPILEGNPHVYKAIEYLPQMDDLFWLEGKAFHEGFFKIAFIPYVNTQKIITFTHNGEDKIAYDLKY
jgi:glycosyltransferase involved in cell wall biosynthesis